MNYDKHVGIVKHRRAGQSLTQCLIPRMAPMGVGALRRPVRRRGHTWCRWTHWLSLSRLLVRPVLGLGRTGPVPLTPRPRRDATGHTRTGRPAGITDMMPVLTFQSSHFSIQVSARHDAALTEAPCPMSIQVSPAMGGVAA